MTMYEYENGKIIKKLIKASQHMKHAQILTQHLENIRNIYRPNEEEIM